MACLMRNCSDEALHGLRAKTIDRYKPNATSTWTGHFRPLP